MSTTDSKNFISLDQAKKMTRKYRADKKKVIKEDYHGKHVLPICETFDRAGFDALLAQPGCVGVRAYYAMDEEMKVHLVIVGVNEKDEDILPSQSFSTMSAESDTSTMSSDGVILDNASRCPYSCPPDSSLNTD